MPKFNVFVLFAGAMTLISIGCNQTEKKEIVKEVKVEKEGHFTMPEIPNSMTFCEQEIDLTGFDAKERLDKELLTNTFYHSSTYQYFKRAHRYFGELERILQEENMPDDLKYLSLIESGLTQAVSPSGAKGFWQFMPAAAKEYGLLVNREIDERYHIEKATRAACAYLKNAYAKFEDWPLTAASYNRGVGGIQSDLESQQVSEYMDLYLNRETGRYFFRMLALKLIFESPEDYGFYPEKMYRYEPRKTRKVNVDKSISDLVQWSIDNGSNYRELKVLNPWILSNTLTVSNTKTYTIELPAK
ncbi:MAG: lytic transglycosylase domain-containing protein [bacterium]|nr:lytic transglycosylase domain-containing protein [bacterium]